MESSARSLLPFWEGPVLGGGGGLCGREGVGGVYFFEKGRAPFDESSDSKCIVGMCLPAVLVARGLGGGALAFGGGGVSTLISCTSSSFSLSRPTIPADTPASSAFLYPTCTILAHSPALYCLEATQTSERTPPCSQFFKPFRMANPFGRVGGKQAVQAAQWQLLRLVAVMPGDAHQPRIPSVDHDIHYL